MIRRVDSCLEKLKINVEKSRLVEMEPVTTSLEPPRPFPPQELKMHVWVSCLLACLVLAC